jgi:ornithine cyclodeaminase
MRVLSQGDVQRLLPMRECIDAMSSVLASLARGTAHAPLRTVLRVPDGSDVFALMPGFLGEPRTLGAKIITVFPGNHGTDRDSHQGAVLLFDATTGALAALVDATAITSIRTAAVSAVATRLLARADATKLAIIGAGVQAHAHLDAMVAVRPITQLRVWSRNPGHAERLVRAAAERYGLAAVACATGMEAVGDADIVCTTTSSTTPVLLGEWLTAGAHVNAIGACTPNARELDSEAVRRSRLYVDRRESALAEPGDLLVPLREGTIAPEHVLAELGELLVDDAAAGARGRQSDSDITLFKSLGLAVEDLAAARLVLDRAARDDAGVQIELGGARATPATGASFAVPPNASPTARA